MNEMNMKLTPEEIGEKSTELNLELTGTKSFETAGGIVEVQWRTFNPERDSSTEDTVVSDRALVYLPGAAMDSESDSVAGLTQHLANYGKVPALAVSSRKEQVELGGQNDLLHQADAIRQLIREKGIKELTIVSNSLGGSKSIDLAYLLQTEHPDIKIEGLVLMGSAGLYEQDSKQIIEQFFKENMVETTKTVAATLFAELKQALFSSVGAAKGKNLPQWDIWKVLQPALSVGNNIRKEMMRYGLKEFTKRLQQEGVNASKANERAGKLEMPIVLVQGTKDTIFEVDKLIPAESKVQGIEAQKLRSDALKQNVFLQSENLVVLLAEKIGHHGVPYFFDNKIAKLALYMLERERRGIDKEKAAEAFGGDLDIAA